MKKFLLSVLSVFAFLAIANSSHALVSCQPIYGGGQSCVTIGQISVEKKVQCPRVQPTTTASGIDCDVQGEFVDQLTISHPRHQPGETVTFQITVTNSSGSTISTITVRDVLPQFVNFVSGPGRFDPNTRTLTFEVNNLAPGATTQPFTIQGRVVDRNQLSQTQSVTCVVNQVTAVGPDNMQAQDNAQLCIEVKVAPAVTKGGLPIMPPPKVITTPPTGPEVFALAALLPSGLAGWFLRKMGGKK